jgi:hypothetical protein
MDHIVITKSVAKEYGINIAIILSNFAFWDSINKANKSEYHLRDGRYWIYYSHKSLAEHLEILTERQVQIAITKMLEEELIELSNVNYNQSKFDKTAWYSLTNKGLSFFVSPTQHNVTSKNTPEVTPTQHNVTTIPDGNHRETSNGNHLAAPAHGNVNAIPASPNIRPNLKIKISDDIREAAHFAWLDLISQKQMEFTEFELMAIKAYSYSKPNLPMHEIESNLYLLDKWSLEGLDIENSLRQSLSTRSLIKPTMRIEYDSRKNRIYNIEDINRIRKNQIERDKTQKSENPK